MQTGTSFVKYGRKTWSKRPQGFVGGRILGRVFGVVRAAGMTLVEYTAAGPGVSGHKAWSKRPQGFAGGHILGGCLA
ncbi:hypothetical protein DEO72_LG8g2435 [Vigna unguiculata]|uniref:Uncharacterized protein n=1 Tax=Vigna unguiculata TaxID=3917 RepID=A0A4D6MWB8_VIGUN|nr:hypothetical protein DEO72_LG8g2435 [Vigna unguiculata]